MNYQPKVSIVIPAYNASNYLAEAIDSALGQSYQNIEVVVVNDGSNDGGKTAEVAHSYGERIRYFEKPNGGSSSALNTGIQHMTGEWFSWLSHDDLYYADKVLEEVQLLNSILDTTDDLKSIHKHVIFAPADLIDEAGQILRKESQKKIQKTHCQMSQPDCTLKLIAQPVQSGFHGCSCLIHRQVFLECGGFDEKLRLLNDMDMWFRLYTNDYKIHFVPKALVLGRIHANQVSRKIGFSYHNPEQDMFWNRSLTWLKEHCPARYDLFYLYGKTALLKTRYKEGSISFQFASQICKDKRLILQVQKVLFICSAELTNWVKKVYLHLKVR